MSGRLRCVLIGAGGHAKVVIETLRAGDPSIDICLIEPRGAGEGQTVLGAPVLGDDSHLPRLLQDGVRWFAVGRGCPGNSQPRAELFALGLALGFEPLTVQHPQALVSPSARLEAGCQVFAGAVIAADAQIGANAIINHRAVVDHDGRIGEHAHVATGAVLSGNVTVGKGAHVGAGAVVHQGLSIGPGAIVGIGAAVVHDVPPGAIVVGVPARPLTGARRLPG
jgi:sugar O-acyltransferase (sialic acid O-acetyltransferase NeuD family)